MKIFTIVVGSIGIFYVFFSEYMIFGYGATRVDKPLITESLPRKSPVTYGIKILFSIMLLFTYPLQIFPANNVLESYLTPGWRKSRKRQCCKNISRTVVVALSCLLAIAAWDNVEKLLAIVGACTCCPMAFTLPSLCHWKLVAKTTKQKTIDLTLVVFSVCATVFCTEEVFRTWSISTVKTC